MYAVLCSDLGKRNKADQAVAGETFFNKGINAKVKPEFCQGKSTRNTGSGRTKTPKTHVRNRLSPKQILIIETYRLL
jgi:hypothetical protein